MGVRYWGGGNGAIDGMGAVLMTGIKVLLGCTYTREKIYTHIEMRRWDNNRHLACERDNQKRDLDEKLCVQADLSCDVLHFLSVVESWPVPLKTRVEAL